MGEPLDSQVRPQGASMTRLRVPNSPLRGEIGVGCASSFRIPWGPSTDADSKSNRLSPCPCVAPEVGGPAGRSRYRVDAPSGVVPGLIGSARLSAAHEKISGRSEKATPWTSAQE